MTTRLITLTAIKPWLIGVLLSTAAMFLGYNLGSGAAGLLGGEPAIWARLGKGLVWGGVIGALQWPIVRAAGVPPVRFLVTSAVGFAAGYPLGQTIQSLILLHWGLNWTAYWSAVATFGLFLGVAQLWIFRRHMRRASLWVLCSVVGWMLTGFAWISFRAGDGLDSVMYGIVTGVSLVWLAHSQPPAVKTNGS